MKFLFALIFFSQIFIFSAFGQTNGSSPRPAFLDTKISATYKKTLEEILQDLSTKAEVDFFYANELEALSLQIEIAFSERSLEEVLDELLLPYNVGYVVVESGIVLVAEEVAASAIQSEEDSIVIKPVTKTSQSASKQKTTYQKLKQQSLFTKNPWEAKVVRNEPRQVEEDSLIYHRKTLRKLQKYYLSQWRNRKYFSAYFSVGPEIAMWRMKPGSHEDIDVDEYNEYQKFNPSFSVNTGGAFHIRRWVLLTGFNFTNLTRKGVHTDYHVDFLNPSVRHEITSNYSSNYHLIGINTAAGYTIKEGFFQIELLAGIDHKFMLQMAGDRYFPYYEPKYFLFGPPYYNEQFVPLEPEKIRFRRYLPVTFQKVNISVFLRERLDLISSISFSQYLKSIYRNNSVVEERPVLVGMKIGVRYNFR